MMDGDLLRLVGIQDQGLKSMRRGRGGSAAASARAASANRANSVRVMARRARAAAGTIGAGLRTRCESPAHHRSPTSSRSLGSRCRLQMQPEGI